MSKQISEIFRKTTTRIKSIAFHPTNPVIITAHHCGTVYVWNLLYQQVISVLRQHTGSVRTVKIHPAGDIFATAGDDKIVRIWNYKTKQVTKILKGHTDYVRSLDFHPSKPWIASVSDDCTIRIWNFYTGEQLSSSSGHSHYIMAVQFLDRDHLLTGSLDHTISLWDCTNLFGKKKFMAPDVIMKQSIDAHDRGVNCLFLHNGTLLSGSDDKETKLWKYQNEALELDRAYYNHEGNVTAVFGEGDSFYDGGEDCIMTVFSGGKTEKIDVGSRIWCITGRDEYIVLGTDDGLVVYRSVFNPAFCRDSNNVYFAKGKKIMRYNMKQTMDYCKVREAPKSMFVHNEDLYVVSSDAYETFSNEKRTGGDVGSIAFVGSDRFTLRDGKIYKNSELFRTGIGGALQAIGNHLLIVNGKTLTVISGEQELSSTFSFAIKSVRGDGEKIAVLTTNRILLLDSSLVVLESINELVEIVDGVFHDGIFFYTTVKQLKYVYGGTGVLQSLDSFMAPVCIDDDYLIALGVSGISKILLNVSEIRFRRSVINDQDILSVIEEEQLPGLCPLEYLIKNNKGGIALPFISDAEKRFQLFMNDGNYKEALKLCSRPEMYRDLAAHSLRSECYDVAEACFKRVKDNHSLFYLYLSTRQLEKLASLEGNEIENMAKIILDDPSIMDTITKRLDEKLCEPANSLAKRLNTVSLSADVLVKCKSEDIRSESSSEKSSSESHDEATVSTGSNLKTDQATFNDSDVQSQIYDISEIDISEEVRNRSVKTVYQQAVDLMTQGKFSRATEVFRDCIALIATKMSSGTDFTELRQRVGNYLLGLHAEKARRSADNPEKRIQLVLLFASLDLEPEHKKLANNLAIMICSKNRNLKTAYEIAEKYPECKNAKKVLEAPVGEDEYAVEIKGLCYDSLCVESAFKECALCGVKSKEGETCMACKIGILH